MGGEAILVVDDTEVNRTLTDIVLTDYGFDVHTSAGGEEALALLRGFHPDLMLVDIRMPGMDGLELTRRVKQSARTRDIVIVALTACAAEGDRQEATATGCDGYITKPIDTHMLGAQVRKYLALRTSVPHAEPVPAGGTSTSDRGVEELRRRFLASCKAARCWSASASNSMSPMLRVFFTSGWGRPGSWVTRTLQRWRIGEWNCSAHRREIRSGSVLF
jgi:CheY-like chemotaxis protein